MQPFWDQRYAENDWVYGEAPNAWFKAFIDSQPEPGRLLLPAEGEGRNAVYAAEKGWEVFAFDFSPVARDKALALAARKGVQIRYERMDIAAFRATDSFDAVGLVFVHLPEPLRKSFHAEIYYALRPGGQLVMEAFTPEQLQYQSGGPKELSLLYDPVVICQDFPLLHRLYCQQEIIELNEGPFHQGKASVMRLLGKRP